MNRPDQSSTQAALPSPQAYSARWHLSSHLRLWVFAVVGLALDLWTKHWAFTTLPAGEGQVIVKHLVRFQRSLNTGALFGLGKGWTPLFIAASVLALAFVLYLFMYSSRERRSLHIGLGLVLAGALGNLHDRSFEVADVVTYANGGKTHTIIGSIIEQKENWVLIGSYPDKTQQQRILMAWDPQHRQQGVVRDFIRMEPSIAFGDRRIDIWPWVFNIADVWLVIGVGLLMLNFWWERKIARKQPEAKPVTPGTRSES